MAYVNLNPKNPLFLNANNGTVIIGRKPAVNSPALFMQGLRDYLVDYMVEFQNSYFYSYALDGEGSNSIDDGGGDMFDNGNFTSPWLLDDTDYTPNSDDTSASYPASLQYSQTIVQTVDTDFVCCSIGYSESNPDTRPLMYLGTRINSGNQVGFQIGGNAGADGGGNVHSAVLYNDSTMNGFNINAFYRQISLASDPSIVNVHVLLGHPSWNSSFGTCFEYSNPDSNSCGSYFYTAGSTNNILAITYLLSKPNGTQLDGGEVTSTINYLTLRIKTHLGL
jgi:hypothetical protein